MKKSLKIGVALIGGTMVYKALTRSNKRQPTAPASNSKPPKHGMLFPVKPSIQSATGGEYHCKQQRQASVWKTGVSHFDMVD